MGRLSWFIQVGPKCNHTYLYKMVAKGDLTDRREGNVSTGKRWSQKLRNAMPGATKSLKWQGTDSSLKPQWECGPASIFILAQ